MTTRILEMVPKKRGFREVGVSDREGDRMVAEGKLSTGDKSPTARKGFRRDEFEAAKRRLYGLPAGDGEE
jgi:hypothetical protein